MSLVDPLCRYFPVVLLARPLVPCNRAIALVLSLFVLLASLGSPLHAQQPVDPHFTFYRVYCVLPLVGTGGPGDPIRPDYVPVPGSSADAAQPQGTSGITAFYHQISDDGKWALAEIVARDRASLAPILTDKRPGVWAVEKGSVPLSEVAAVFSKFKKNIDMTHFGVAVR